MNWLSFHLASGESLFTGTIALVVGVFLPRENPHWLRLLSNLLIGLGIAFIFLSSTPFPFWASFLLLASLAGWIFGQNKTRWSSPNFRRISQAVLLVTAMSLALAEIPHQRLPSLPQGKYACVRVIGDSISAGIDENPNWVDLLRKRVRTKIENLAKPAATLDSAIKQAENIPLNSDCLVLLEIGGNDVLGFISSKAFEAELTHLLMALQGRHRTILMFELPLLPGQASLGRIQRTVAKKYGVHLIPKRYFCKVLGAPDATTDGLHLSAIGGSLMADLVHRLIGEMVL